MKNEKIYIDNLSSNGWLLLWRNGKRSINKLSLLQNAVWKLTLWLGVLGAAFLYVPLLAHAAGNPSQTNYDDYATVPFKGDSQSGISRVTQLLGIAQTTTTITNFSISFNSHRELFAYFGTMASSSCASTVSVPPLYDSGTQFQYATTTPFISDASYFYNFYWPHDTPFVITKGSCAYITLLDPNSYYGSGQSGINVNVAGSITPTTLGSNVAGLHWAFRNGNYYPFDTNRYNEDMVDHNNATDFVWWFDTNVALASSTPDTAVTLDIPTSGQVLNDFNKWTISAKTDQANSALRIIYYDDFGGYFTDVLDPAYSETTMTQRNYDKAIPLHTGHWQASAQLLSSSSVVLTVSPWSNFTIVSRVPTSTTGIFTLESCPDFNLSSSTLDSIACHANVFLKEIANGFQEAINILVQNIGAVVVKIFPFNVFAHLNNDFNMAKNSTSSPDVVLTSTDTTNFFYNANFVILSSSTVGKLYEKSNFSLRTFLTYLMFAVIGLLMLKVAISTAHSLKNRV